MKSMDQDRLRTTLTQAVARAWATPPNTNKAMDPDLVSAAVDQIMALAEAPNGITEDFDSRAPAVASTEKHNPLG